MRRSVDALAPRVVESDGPSRRRARRGPGDAIVKVHGAYVDATISADAFHGADVAAAARAEACGEQRDDDDSAAARRRRRRRP